MREKALPKLALLVVLLSLVGFSLAPRPASACQILECPDLWTWAGCQRLCVCETAECCQFYYGYDCTQV
jgi:hypothetical protein